MKERDSTPPATLPEAPAATEGVIQFRYTLRAPGAADRIGSTVLATLEACRATLRNAGLIGRDANRYGGFAFGNVSAR
ncbi:MAG: hypothetical protein HC809_00365, partial [Gammaproteobacteria bacterium]|nr:hypothetical protein [Gammaproteobacteria bacterium]